MVGMPMRAAKGNYFAFLDTLYDGSAPAALLNPALGALGVAGLATLPQLDRAAKIRWEALKLARLAYWQLVDPAGATAAWAGVVPAPYSTIASATIPIGGVNVATTPFVQVGHILCPGLITTAIAQQHFTRDWFGPAGTNWWTVSTNGQHAEMVMTRGLIDALEASLGLQQMPWDARWPAATSGPKIAWADWTWPPGIAAGGGFGAALQAATLDVGGLARNRPVDTTWACDLPVFQAYTTWNERQVNFLVLTPANQTYSPGVAGCANSKKADDRGMQAVYLKPNSGKGKGGSAPVSRYMLLADGGIKPTC